ncbi:MAG TPA: lysylphosphatidylglycerol synthase transmembrane domain-containing protein [Gemmatimonadales bacterium]|nr:lysylphosphatidylglycerol synthase transmembrane domain-containing protein [Gemmatimonadales bacterium]
MTAPAPARRPPLWQALIGIAVSVALLYWTLRGTNLSEVWATVRAAAPGPVLLGVVLATIPFFLRVPRWQLLLRAEDDSPLPPKPLWDAIAIGFMANNTLPLRMGELVRAVAGSRFAGVRFTSTLASLAVERLMDVLAVVLLLGLGLLGAGLSADTRVAGVRLAPLVLGFGGIALGGLVVGALVVAYPRAAESIIERVVPWPRLAARLTGLIEGVTMGMSALRSPRRLAGVLLWTLAIWVCNAASFYAMFSAFGIPTRFPGALVLQGAIMFLIAVPSSPGYFGVFEAPVKAILGLYGVPAAVAVSYAFTYHFTTFIPITALGLWSVARTGFGLKDAGVRAA